MILHTFKGGYKIHAVETEKMKYYLLLLFVIVGARAIYAQKRPYDTVPNMPEHYWVQMEKFKKEAAVPGKTVFVGNSITEAGQWKKLLKDSAVINRGISGDNTFGLLARVSEIIKLKPSKLFILIGTNDLSRNIPDEAIIENIFTFLSKVKGGSPNTKIFVQSILPVNETIKIFPQQYKDNGSHILIINDQLSRYADRMRYTYIDLYSNFLDEQGKMKTTYTTDGLHLNEAGYQRWVEVLKTLKYL